MSDIGVKNLGKCGGSSFECRTDFYGKMPKRPKAFNFLIQISKK